MIFARNDEKLFARLKTKIHTGFESNFDGYFSSFQKIPFQKGGKKSNRDSTVGS